MLQSRVDAYHTAVAAAEAEFVQEMDECMIVGEVSPTKEQPPSKKKRIERGQTLSSDYFYVR